MCEKASFWLVPESTLQNTMQLSFLFIIFQCRNHCSLGGGAKKEQIRNVGTFSWALLTQGRFFGGRFDQKKSLVDQKDTFVNAFVFRQFFFLRMTIL